MKPSTSEKKSGKIAIIGMACLFPGAPDLATYWSNIVRSFDATREVTDKEWSLADYYDSDASTFGKSYSKRGGFITEFAEFDPLKYGIMPSAVAGSDPDQMLTLKIAQDAMLDAGYLNRPGSPSKTLDRDRAEIIIGRISAPGAGCMNLVQQCKTVNEISAILRGVLPEHNEELLEQLAAQIQANLQPVNSDTIPGAMPNVLAGRLAAKLGFRGRNMLIDAACASSMVAVETAVSDLLENRCDFALAGGVHINSSAVFFQMFCGLGALSHNDSIRPFDQSADGTMLGEGVGMICLKRLEDAEADGDRIYATICGVASSSDGLGGSVLAPSADGEALAMTKAYAMSGISPTTIELLEAHGTGTPTGDVVELQAVEKVFKENSGDIEPWCAVGSVKSMIGHCQSASAIAGIIKTTLALHHKVLPPTLNVTQPNTKINWAKHPCYVNTQTRPWLRGENRDHPRRAAVSAFGFGGINGHCILEESKDNESSLIHEWENELFTLSSPTRAGLLQDIAVLRGTLTEHKIVPKDLAFTLNCRTKATLNGFRLAIVAASSQELIARLDIAAEQISNKDQAVEKISETKKGIYFTAPEALLGGTTAFLYPGLGSAYTNMLGDLCVLFPEIREVFEIVDNVAMAAGATELPSKVIFPQPFIAGERTGSPSLAAADFAVVAVLLAEYALHHFLQHLDIKPDAIMGCSTGEFAAITTGGSVDVLSQAQTFYKLSTEVARSIPEESLADLRSLRILAPAEAVMNLVSPADKGSVHLSADLGDEHSLVTGSAAAIDRLNNILREHKMPCHLLPIAIPYHTPLVQAVMVGNEAAVRAVEIEPLAIPGWSCSTAERYPDDIEGIRTFFTELFTKPVSLRKTIRSMYAYGVRKFIEVGPSGILSSMIGSILPQQPHIAIPTNLASKSGLTQIHHLLANLFVQEVPAKLDYLYQRREPALVDWQTHVAKAAARGPQLLLAHAGLTIDTSTLPKVTGLKNRSKNSGPGHNYDLDQDQEFDNEVDSNFDQDQIDSDDYESEAAQDFEPGSEGQQRLQEQLVVQQFLNTSASFYNRLSSVSEQVMRSYIDGQPDFMAENSSNYVEAMQPFGGSGSHFDDHQQDISENPNQWLRQFDHGQSNELPFLSRCQVFENGEATELFLTLNLATDLYLQDHAIGGLVSVVDKTRVHLVPLMVSLEIMAEAAMAHFNRSDNGVVVRLEQVKAFKRLVVDQNQLSLRMIVSGADNKIHVEMTEADNPTILMMADYIFASGYPASPHAKLNVSGPPASNLKERSQLYGPRMMFHGPSMQAVQSLDQVGNKAIGGRATATAAAHWMPNLPAANFLLNPLLLDNASQFVLFYLYEKNLSATALLPFFIESVDFFADPADLAAEVKVAATLPALSERATEAEVEVFDNGSIALRVNSINSRRVLLSQQWQDFVENPSASWLGQQIAVAEHLKDRCAIIQVSQTALSEDDVILEWCLDYILTKIEAAQWRSESQTKKRKMDWLLGRIAAKEAVRILVRNSLGKVLGPHDVEISNNANRSPVATIRDQDVPEIAISISHTSGFGFALATFVNAGQPGIDAEVITAHPADFATSFMQKAEVEYMNSCQASAKDTELTRIWAAKEAMYKANHGSIEASSFERKDASNNTVIMTGGTRGGQYKTYTLTAENMLIAYTLLEPGAV